MLKKKKNHSRRKTLTKIINESSKLNWMKASKGNYVKLILNLQIYMMRCSPTQWRNNGHVDSPLSKLSCIGPSNSWLTALQHKGQASSIPSIFCFHQCFRYHTIHRLSREVGLIQPIVKPVDYLKIIFNIICYTLLLNI